MWHAEPLSGPAAGQPLQPATGGGPGLVSGSYGSANAAANSGESAPSVIMCVNNASALGILMASALCACCQAGHDAS